MGVLVLVGVVVGSGVLVAVWVAVAVGVKVGVKVGDAVAVGVAVLVAVAVGVAVCVAVGVFVGVGVGQINAPLKRRKAQPASIRPSETSIESYLGLSITNLTAPTLLKLTLPPGGAITRISLNGSANFFASGYPTRSLMWIRPSALVMQVESSASHMVKRRVTY